MITSILMFFVLPVFSSLFFRVPRLCCKIPQAMQIRLIVILPQFELNTSMKLQAQSSLQRLMLRKALLVMKLSLNSAEDT